MNVGLLDESVLDLASVPILLLDEAGRIVRMNRQCREAAGLVGFEAGELPFWEVLVPAHERGSAEEKFRAGRDQGAGFTIESGFPGGAGGRKIAWSCKAAPDGNILATGLEVQGCTGETEAESEQYRLLFESNPHPMWVFDGETLAFLAVNNAAVLHYGYSRDEFLAMTLADIRPVEDVPALLSDVGRHTEGIDAPSGFWRHRKKDGTEIEVEITSVCLTYAGRDARLVLANDVTARNRAERARNETERRYRDLVENAPIGIYRTTPDGRILLANPASLRMLGYSNFEELASRNLETQTFEPDYARSEFKRQIEETGEIRGHEARWERRDGTTIHFRESARAIYGPDGVIACYEGTVEDITKRKLAEQALRASEAQFRAVFEGAATGILVLDPDGTVRDSNRAAQDMLGFREHELRGREYASLVVAEDAALIESATRRMLDHAAGPVRLEMRLRRRDGETIWGRVTASLVRGVKGEPEFAIVMIDDVTAKKETEEQLRRTVEELGRSNAELQDFAYVASHDLQEPLRMVTSFMQLLRMRYAAGLDAEANQYIGFAVDGAKRMKVLIDDLLAYSRLGSHVKPFRMTRTRAAFEQAVANLAVAIDESGAEILAENLPVLAADPGQLVQLLQNLIGNAVKFRDGRRPLVRVTALRSGCDWTFSVADNGIGIPPGQRERIFDIFHRLHRKDEYPGSGIGLTVCKRIVERHRGRIWVEPAPDGGSVFRFTIPDLPCGEQPGDE